MNIESEYRQALRNLAALEDNPSLVKHIVSLAETLGATAPQPAIPDYVDVRLTLDELDSLAAVARSKELSISGLIYSELKELARQQARAPEPP